MGKVRHSLDKTHTGVIHPNNVIPLSRYLRFCSERPLIYYINDNRQWYGAFSALADVSWRAISSTDELKGLLMIENPQLIFVECELKWTEPLDLIMFLSYRTSAPIVLICENSEDADCVKLIRKAYSMGVHDTLYHPVRFEDLAEITNVLLKFQSQTL